MILQFATFGITRVSVPGLFRDMEKGKLAPARLLASISLSASITEMRQPWLN